MELIELPKPPIGGTREDYRRYLIDGINKCNINNTRINIEYKARLFYDLLFHYNKEIGDMLKIKKI